MYIPFGFLTDARLPPRILPFFSLLPSKAIDNGDDLDSNEVDGDLENNTNQEQIEILQQQATVYQEQAEILQQAATVYQEQAEILRQASAVFQTSLGGSSPETRQLLNKLFLALDEMEPGDLSTVPHNILQYFGWFCFAQRALQIGGLSKIKAASNNEWIEIVAKVKDYPSFLYYILREDPGRFENMN